VASAFFAVANAESPSSAPGYSTLPYQVPAAGSYELPPLGTASDGLVLDTNGEQRSLHTLLQGKYTLLNFMYSSCSDVNGCPLSSYVFYRIKSLMRQRVDVADSLQLISLSFDPQRDTPELMKLYSANFDYAGEAGEWHFLTTKSEVELEPLLSGYKQDVQRDLTLSAGPNTQYAHVLRVFLIDPELQIRNIYSVEFLHSDILITDFETLEMSAGKHPVRSNNTLLSKPGDNRENYHSNDYETHNQSLTARTGKATDLLHMASEPQLGVPSLEEEVLSNLSKEKISLSRKLFFDRRLSLNDTFSCAMCHIPEQGFSSNELKTPVGVEGRSVRRNSPSLYNVAFAKSLFHDAREFRLEEQIWSPLLAHNEMANPSVGYVLNKLQNLPDYEGLFESIYGSGVSMSNLGDAMAAYQRVLISANSPFDRWHFGDDANALSQSAQRGYEVFKGKGGCINCHLVGTDTALFTDDQLHNTGVGYAESMGIKSATVRVALAPGVFAEVDREIVDGVSLPPPADLGRYEITQNPQDRWKYKTPGLRNVSLSAPYMHNGSLATLKDVVLFYNNGGINNPTISPLLRPLNLNDQEIDDLQAFLQSLTGNNVDAIVSDAFAAPVGDLTQQDPNWANQQHNPLQGEPQ